MKVAAHRAKCGNLSSSDKDSSIAGARPIKLSHYARRLLLARVMLLESAA